VKNPVMFYVGIIALVSDFVFEYLYILNKQFSYATSQGDVSVGWFLGAAILTAIFLLIGNHLKLHLSKRKKK
jgi:uncharacterized membrane protein